MPKMARQTGRRRRVSESGDRPYRRHYPLEENVDCDGQVDVVGRDVVATRQQFNKGE
ncbi:hypothetical protein MCOR25_007230 [Pyricularia grisea]|nr:hypothetical protein MCOR25_007230 [Pyricularia grisea]